ncbi:hypothetical protein ISN45_Aa01g009600 [Arabidopsis thaliana x Arabidopsis arenosa]|uniref:Uncharacterized protein n=1 Tax=Arabidopsis thaliana x Arabidopsis arenosa TaxID=1240361 RepID=A0A8T2BZC3_9BRAS|nr:hypothetical protein ISN45_Aa01g009600 [Arabidopsis thaliana x Arabidopsis arenosa]
MKRYCSAALVLLLVAFFSSKHSVEGRSLLTQSGQAVRDYFHISKEMKKEPLRGEKDSFRKIPSTGSNPIPNSSDMSASQSSSSLTVTLDSINTKGSQVLKSEYAVRGETVNIGQ